MLVQLELLVVNDAMALGWRIWAWAKLVKTWASLRWSDLQAILPAELSMVEVLRKRRIRALPAG